MVERARRLGRWFLALDSLLVILGFFVVMPMISLRFVDQLGWAAGVVGLALGLLIQGLLFAPFDLPQYGMNVTTLLVPLFALQALAARIIAPGTAYVDLRYAQALALSTVYQGGVVAWVAFWAIYGQGFAGISGIATFGAAYMLVVLIEPLVDLAVLAGAKSLRGLRDSGLVTSRLFA